MNFSPIFCYFLAPRSKYSQHPVLEHNQCSCLRARHQASHPWKTKNETVLYILSWHF